MIPKFALLTFITLVPACWLIVGIIGKYIRLESWRSIRAWRGPR